MSKIFVMLLMLPTLSYAQSVETLWRARSLEASEKTEKLKKKAKLTPDEECQLFLETGLSTLNNKSHQYNLIEKRDSGDMVITIPIASKSRHLTIATFFYDKGADKPTTGGSQSDAVEWATRAFKNGLFGISNDDCAYLFDLNDPFSIHAGRIKKK